MDEFSATHQDVFPTTRWSLVLATSQGGDGERAALDELCRKYWQPVRSFFSLRGVRGVEEAEDLTQEYFASLLAREYLSHADQSRGRFRAFLVQDLKFFLWDALAKRQAGKRGANMVFVPLDTSVIEAEHAAENTAIFDHQWALQIVHNAREQLRADYEKKGKGDLFRLLQHGLVRSLEAADYEQWAAQMSMSPGALKVALHRLRGRFRKALEDQVRETVSSDEDFEEEMRHLRRALREAASEE